MKKQYFLPEACVMSTRVVCVICTSESPASGDVHNEKGPMGQLAPSRPTAVEPERMSN